ncbi:MAG: NAD-dependent protein deacylase [Synergistes sp.]|nr:NAD-dependent protein deacylase [Synergistes sp.]
MDAQERLQQMVDESNYIVFFGGAGVSTESGIPDFRSETGIYNTVKHFGYPPEQILSHSFFMRHTDVFYQFCEETLYFDNVEPNAAHKALAKMEQAGKLKAVVTQNIDGLHQAAGSKVVYELHGSLERNYCMRCGKSFDIPYMRAAKGVPKCDKCGGIVKPDVVLYEESLDGDVIDGAVRAIAKADMLIIGGTSLNVYPAAGFINYYRGNRLVLINKSETPYDHRADLVIHDSIGDVLSKVRV